MKRIIAIAIAGIAVGYWYPIESLMVGAGTLLGWFALPQPDIMVTAIDKAKALLNQ